VRKFTNFAKDKINKKIFYLHQNVFKNSKFCLVFKFFFLNLNLE